MRKKIKGFSVIEIVLVLGVIGILSSFIAPKVRDYLAMAKDSKVINALQSLRMANETYYLENGNYPMFEQSNITTILVVLEKYIGNKFQLTNGELLLDVGGSKEMADSKDIKYGGKIKIEIENNDFILKPTDEIYKFNLRGDEWSKL
ncbi:type II secretion system GspH family protein [Cetobacterium somerae]|uniref:type II secretion system protein n=1 Tax=Cetobacterium sp. NK01 TaxID=2993530 RepID=UPI0021160D81|nr:prepilin-type N-terminal cleavage/methylation domain-containing protein [Cetobacterium sp. NK01]MCQ8211926.1 type II secretion system GspH family protein [Cetobacterium sp. NK01]